MLKNMTSDRNRWWTKYIDLRDKAEELVELLEFQEESE